MIGANQQLQSSLLIAFLTGCYKEFLNVADRPIIKHNISKSSMAANLCPSQPRMNVEILLSACNSPDKLGLSDKIIHCQVGFQNCIEQWTLTEGEHC